MVSKSELQKFFMEEMKITEGTNMMVSCGDDVNFETIEEKETGLLMSLLKSITYMGTLMSPSWTTNAVPFDANNSPTFLNSFHQKISMVKDNSARSLHPTHSATIIGQNAKDFSSEHHLAFSPFDLNYSPYGKLLKKQMGLLVGFGNFYNVLGHLVEETVGVDYPMETKYRKFEMTDSKGAKINSYGFSYYLTMPRYFGKLNEYMYNAKVMTTKEIDGLKVTTIVINKYVQFATMALRANKTLFIKE